MKIKKNGNKTLDWETLITMAEAKLRQTTLKTSQLQALIATMREQAKAGDKCPSEVSNLSIDLTNLLH